MIKVLAVFCLVLCTFWTSTAKDVQFSAIKCHKYPAPKNGQMYCTTTSGSSDVTCSMKCNKGYDVNFLGSKTYVCNDNGSWTTMPPGGDLPWPDCRIYGRGEPVP
ncbi:sushi repeat-containing protein SRPX [Exaiptasia diaphana]|uniref:Sushi domain-containing protein n=1 Tax=Exaiptasia diaphana TaxID=2652724 RepID=A0A913YM25_EXADI|nr:sushi repeat-containing protein SRPX [Exaiptasia diaphana]XP_028516184.1 sushi repeat-containing protein SRPX [Exaiptasia diaphana]